jgi:hypothetical protein
MVTPTALNGAGCAAAVLTVNADARNKATKVSIFTDASLLSWTSTLLAISSYGEPAVRSGVCAVTILVKKTPQAKHFGMKQSHLAIISTEPTTGSPAVHS